MTQPSTFLPALNAVQQIISGTLGSIYQVPLGTFNLGKAWDNQQDREIGLSLLGTDNIFISWESSVNQNRWQETYSQSIYDLDLKVVVETTFSGTVIKDDDRKTAQAMLLNKMHLIRAALTFPGNLTNDASNNFTGISSGMLEFVNWQAPKWIWSGTAYGQSIMTFKAIITLDKNQHPFSFTPIQLTGSRNMTLWVGPESLTASVVRWNDQGPSGNHLTVSSGIGFSTSLINGYQALTVTGSAMVQYLTAPSNKFISASAYHVFSVANLSFIRGSAIGTTSNACESFIGDNNGGLWGIRVASSGGTGILVSQHQTPTNFNLLNSPLPLSQSVLVEAWLTGNVLFSRIGTIGNFSIVGGPISNITNITTFFRNYTGVAAGYMSGSIAEMVVFCEALTGSDQQNMRQYLGSKYGVVY